LGPDGKTFTTPLQLSVRYDDHDLEGTVPEALAIAYQDAKGAWHGQTSARLDQGAKTLTISTTHFTDEAFLARVRIEPIEATIRVGETHVVTLYHCKEPGEEPFSISRLFRQPRNCSPVSPGANAWSLRGAGTLEPWSKDGVLYKAPVKKPTPNIVFVVVTYKFEMWNPTTGEIVLGQKAFGAQITIVDRGYRASGNAGGDTVFSGDICDLAKHFTLKTNNPFLPSFEFYPDKDSSTKGKWSFSTENRVTGGGSGRYTVTGTGAVKTGIEMEGFSRGRGLVGPDLSGSGPMHLDLVPLDKCGN
jgi:hypothetical protein